MDRKAFKQRMQNLKSYRDNNPGKGYWDWRNSLPDNLKYTDDAEYDMYEAYKSGVQPEYIEEDNSYHLPTRDPNTGKILKKSIHPTFWKGLTEDAKLGYDAYFVGDDVYTKSKYEGPIQAFADGGEKEFTDDRTDHAINKPIILEQIERAIGPADRINVPLNTKYSDLTDEQRMQLRQSDILNKDSRGIKAVSPEFDVLTGIRSLAQLPKGFWNNSATKNVATNYYRQGAKGLIDDAKDTGIVAVKSNLATNSSPGKITLASKTFDVPFWSKGYKWYGNSKTIGKDMIVSTGDNNLIWQPITQHGSFTENLVKAGSRRTPIYNGTTNNTPSNLFEFYRNYPLIGYRNVTNGYPTLPITGLNTA